MNVIEYQTITKAILREVDTFCNKHDIEYCIVFGTLIGAIRHKDFIPWDDDIDIMMPRPDFQKFCELWKKEYAESYYELFLPFESPGYPYMLGRVSDSRYPIQVNNEAPYGMGLFVDIYPFDGLGNTKFTALLRGTIADTASSLCFQSTRLAFPEKMFSSGPMKLIGKVAYRFSKVVGTENWMKFIRWLPRLDYHRSAYVACLDWLADGWLCIYPREWFSSRIRAPFGDVMTWIPIGYDEHLRHAYGDYMQLPPESEQVGHHDYIVLETPEDNEGC